MKKSVAILILFALGGTGWLVARGISDHGPVRTPGGPRGITGEPEPDRVAPAVEPGSSVEPEQTSDPARPAQEPGKAKPRPYRVAEETGRADRAALRVLVVDRSGRALADINVGVTLSIDGVGRAGPRAGTDAAGRVLFEELKADEVIAVHIRVGDLGRSALVRLTSGRVTEVTFRIADGFAVRGRVRDVESGPIPKVSVGLSRSAGDGFRDYAYGLTDEQGAYSIEGLPPGSYKVRISGGSARSTVRVTRDGVEPLPAKPTRRIEYHERDQGELEVVPPGPVTRDIILGRLSIEGVVRDAATGAPLTGVTVNLQSPRWARTGTDAQGRFRIASMPPGQYTVLLKKDGYALKFVKEVEIRKNEVTRVEFTIERAARLQIHLKDPDGKPVTGEYYVSFNKPVPKGAPRRGWTSNLRTDAEGRILSRVVPLGALRISVSGAGWKGGPVGIEIKEGENSVEIPLLRTGAGGVISLSGIVRDHGTGAPIAGVRLRIQAAMVRETFSDKSGRFVFEDLRPGGYRVHAGRDGYGETTVGGIKVEAGKQAVIDVELRRAATIHLRVTDSAGLPIAGRVHFVYSGGVPSMGRGLYLDLDEDGRASFARLAPGPYSISVLVEGRGKGSAKLEIAPGENTLEVRIEGE